MNTVLRRTLFAATLVLFCGCQSEPAAPLDPDSEEAFEFLSSLSVASLDSAFTELNRTVRTVESHTVELSEAGDTLGSSLVGVEVFLDPTQNERGETELASRVTVDYQSSSGTLASGDSVQWDGEIRNPIPAMFSGEPAFLSPRTREHYTFALQPDTVVNGQPLHVVAARLNPDNYDDQAVRNATYYVHGTETIRGVHILRVSNSALFDESSEVTVWLYRPWESAPDALMPASVRVENEIHTAAGRTRRLVTEYRVLEVLNH